MTTVHGALKAQFICWVFFIDAGVTWGFITDDKICLQTNLCCQLITSEYNTVYPSLFRVRFLCRKVAEFTWQMLQIPHCQLSVSSGSSAHCSLESPHTSNIKSTEKYNPDINDWVAKLWFRGLNNNQQSSFLWCFFAVAMPQYQGMHDSLFTEYEPVSNY